MGMLINLACCSGQPPSEDWTIQPVANRQTLQLRSSARTATKDLNRVQVPFSQGVGLFYHLNALEDPRQMYVILAGPSVFSPECLGRYGLLNKQIINGTLSDTDMPANWNVIVDRISLEKLQTCVRTHNKDLFWTSKAGYVYPMMSIAPDGWFSWTPRILSSWIPPNKLREFLDNYEFKNGDRTDPRIPRRFWPNGVNFSFPGPLKVAIPRQ
ncbi:hypothetical protein SAMD00023353_2401340 [Rosellinia necatrix]|uniref:Uncharacterized protein n=1 Tax=Rosellinia necatrix TaxID=77044 RepID=A0A1W2TFX3_ROSNE|nr:hypothetical protein SAMD00023353_2401340 [Rosellinia necatrix]